MATPANSERSASCIPHSALVRRPVVAGYFYPAEPEMLRCEIERLVGVRPQPITARAVIVPHGSFQRCGTVLGDTLGRIDIPRRCVILAPAHTQMPARWSLMDRGAYRTPLGDVPIDEVFAERLSSHCPFLEIDASGQQGEHAIEVLVPLLQVLGPVDLTLVPILINTEEIAELTHLGAALAELITHDGEPTLLCVSTDLSQHESHERAMANDRTLIERLQTLQAPSGVTMCGAAAVQAALHALQRLGARRGTLIQYTTSVAAGGDPDSVTGYAGMIFE